MGIIGVNVVFHISFQDALSKSNEVFETYKEMEQVFTHLTSHSSLCLLFCFEPFFLLIALPTELKIYFVISTLDGEGDKRLQEAK